jgi:proteasome lid subunit RPN8/RPN11
MAKAREEGRFVDVLSASARRTLARCLEIEATGEICGYLLIDTDGNQQVHLLNNWAIAPDAFFVSTLEGERLRRHAARERLRIAAFIHSHDRSLELSDRDIAGLLQDEIPWIVIIREKNGIAFRVHSRQEYSLPACETAPTSADP